MEIRGGYNDEGAQPFSSPEILPNYSVECITACDVVAIGHQLPTKTEATFEAVPEMIHETKRVHNERRQADSRRMNGGDGNGTNRVDDIKWNTVRRTSSMYGI